MGEVQPQAGVLDGTGAVVARADLLLTGTRRIHEYDGAVHRTADQHGADLPRDKILARLGYERYGYTAAEIVSRPARIVADAEAAQGLLSDRTAARDYAGDSTVTQEQPSVLTAVSLAHYSIEWGETSHLTY
ncbi:MAG: hypothetical protein WKF83_17000 [Nocardioidaceae bacterium]